MFGPIAPWVYVCVCGWKRYVHGSPSDVLVSDKQLPPEACAQCGSSDLHSRAPYFWEQWRAGSLF